MASLSEEEDAHSESTFERFSVEIITLKKLALKCIIKNFERFHAAYEVSENPTVRRCLLALQRKHTDELLQDLTFFRIEEKYLEFFLNEHMTDFNVSSFDGCCKEKVVKRIEEVGHGIREIDFSATVLTSEYIHQILRNVPNVEIVYFNDDDDTEDEYPYPFAPTLVSDETLRIISTHCRNVRELYIDFKSHNTDFVSSTEVERILENVPGLAIFKYRNLVEVLHRIYNKCRENKTDSKTYKLTSLNFLCYETNDLTDSVIACAEMCPEVESVCLPAYTSEHATLFSLFPNIKKAKLVGQNWKVIFDAQILTGVQNLKELDISTSNVLLKNLSEACPLLESIHLSNAQMSSLTGVTPFTKLKHLVIEAIDYISVTRENNPYQINYLLRSCPRLERLTISDCAVRDPIDQKDIGTFIESLPSNHLKYVELNSVSLQMTHLTQLVEKCQHLEFLSVRGCPSISVRSARRVLPPLLHPRTHLEIGKKVLSDIFDDEQDELFILQADDYDMYDSVDDDDFGDYDDDDEYDNDDF